MLRTLAYIAALASFAAYTYADGTQGQGGETVVIVLKLPLQTASRPTHRCERSLQRAWIPILRLDKFRHMRIE